MYETMWLDLKQMLIKKRAFHRSGMMQSIGESIHGEYECTEILNYIDSLEKEHLGKTLLNELREEYEPTRTKKVQEELRQFLEKSS